MQSPQTCSSIKIKLLSREKIVSGVTTHECPYVSVYLTMMPKQTAMAAWSSVVSTVNLTWAACCTMLLAPAPTRDTR